MLLRKAGAAQLAAIERQRTVMLQQLELQIRPYFIIESPSRPFSTKNIGAGPALNVQVHDVHLPPITATVLRFSPSVFPHVPAGAVCNLEVADYVEGRKTGDMLTAHLNPVYAQWPLQVRITYENVEGRAYTVDHEIEPGRLRLRGLKTAN
jgi:hypothetical protein